MQVKYMEFQHLINVDEFIIQFARWYLVDASQSRQTSGAYLRRIVGPWRPSPDAVEPFC